MNCRAFIAEPQGSGLTTAEIHYFRPGAPSLLQLFVRQNHDVAPAFSARFDFLDHRRRDIESAGHSLRIARDHSSTQLIWKAIALLFRQSSILPMRPD